MKRGGRGRKKMRRRMRWGGGETERKGRIMADLSSHSSLSLFPSLPSALEPIRPIPLKMILLYSLWATAHLSALLVVLSDRCVCPLDPDFYVNVFVIY